MKFLCVKCDEAMALKGAEGSDDNSVSIIFACQRCGNSIAMLANPMEAQLVKGLGVHVGGRNIPYKPMEVIKATLLIDKDGSNDVIPWDKEAEARLLNVPPFAKSMAKIGIEKYAREKGYKRITTDVVGEARKACGM